MTPPYFARLRSNAHIWHRLYAHPGSSSGWRTLCNKDVPGGAEIVSVEAEPSPRCSVCNLKGRDRRAFLRLATRE